MIGSRIALLLCTYLAFPAAWNMTAHLKLPQAVILSIIFCLTAAKAMLPLEDLAYSSQQSVICAAEAAASDAAQGQQYFTAIRHSGLDLGVEEPAAADILRHYLRKTVLVRSFCCHVAVLLRITGFHLQHAYVDNLQHS